MFEMYKGTSRSIFLPNKLWRELKAITKECCPVSDYVRIAIIEKMIRECPKKEDYSRNLLNYK